MYGQGGGCGESIQVRYEAEEVLVEEVDKESSVYGLSMGRRRQRTRRV
jgi:hypothetical protein